MIGNHPAKDLGDIGATIATGISVASQWAQVLTPIATLTLSVLGIIWWCIRFREWLIVASARSERRP